MAASPFRRLLRSTLASLMASPVAECKFTRVETRFPTLALDDSWSYPARYVATEHESSTIREELARVLSSSGFTRSERLSRFLRFVVERHLEGRDQEVKESLIGVEVFGRKPDYDPKLDSVVTDGSGAASCPAGGVRRARGRP